jgi:hypothetical protein
MPALVAGIHALISESKAWMAGTSPAMTINYFTGAASGKNRSPNTGSL